MKRSINQIQTFNFNTEEIRILQINGEPWFVGKDVCAYFGDKHYRRSLSRLDIDLKGVTQIATPGGEQKMVIVNEAGLYNLLFLMQPQKANLANEEYEARISQVKAFRKWITSEVLPSIRKTGQYGTYQKLTAREWSKQVRKSFTDTLAKHGCDAPKHFINITYAHKKELQIPRDKKKDEYDNKELLLTIAAEAITQFHVESKDLNGYHSIKPEAMLSARSVYDATIGRVEHQNLFLNDLDSMKIKEIA